MVLPFDHAQYIIQMTSRFGKEQNNRHDHADRQNSFLACSGIMSVKYGYSPVEIYNHFYQYIMAWWLFQYFHRRAESCPASRRRSAARRSPLPAYGKSGEKRLRFPNQQPASPKAGESLRRWYKKRKGQGCNAIHRMIRGFRYG